MPIQNIAKDSKSGKTCNAFENQSATRNRHRFLQGLAAVVIRVCATTDHLRIISPHLGENAVNE